MTKNEAQVDIDLFNYLSSQKLFSGKWNAKKLSNKYIEEILSGASKSNTGNRGEPDLIYLNDSEKILILVENKDKLKDHKSSDKVDPKMYAVDGVKHYLQFFLPSKLKKNKPATQSFFKGFKIIGIAFSGDIHDELNHLVDTFIIQGDSIKDASIKEFLNEEDYIALFENIDLELIAANISKSSNEINRMFRNIDSQKRPVLLSALMICLYEKGSVKNDFKDNYQNYVPETVITHILSMVERILKGEGLSQDKINILINELSFIKTDYDLNNSRILADVLDELENNVIPLFNKKTNYDIIGKFYEEFLRYAGIANVKNGIVLTPNHITTLFSELIPIKYTDKILDGCCGTGAFLISGMNALMDIISRSEIPDKSARINNIKQDQLLGFEKSNTMYSLAISNMLFRGDGKSKIHSVDFFSEEATSILKKEKPTIGFINPPYGGLDNGKNPTKKEIQFLEHMLDHVSRYGVVIAPQSTFFKDNLVRNRILVKHTLESVINMPRELFQPNASTHVAIAVFKTHSPHNAAKTVFYDLKEDGFVLSKNKGRTDIYSKWNKIKTHLLSNLKDPSENRDNINLVYKSLEKNDEWVLQAHQKTDPSDLDAGDFILSIKKYLIFKIKLDSDILNKKLDAISMMEVLHNRGVRVSNKKTSMSLCDVERKDFKVADLFEVKGTKTTPLTSLNEYGFGKHPYITTRATNNGVDGFYDHYTEEGNVLTVDSATIGSCFYQSKEFSASDHVEKLIPAFSYVFNVYIALFFTTILAKEQYRYGYGRKFNQIRIKETILSLPVDSKGDPNWQFMENYIKSLPYSNNL